LAKIDPGFSAIIEQEFSPLVDRLLNERRPLLLRPLAESQHHLVAAPGA